MSIQDLTSELIRDFVIAGHGNFPKVKAMLAENPALLNAAYEWSEHDFETALQGAAHVGNVVVAEFLLAQGAPLDICTAAMLGRKEEVERLLRDNPDLIQATGGHNIPLLAHAAHSENLPLLQLLVEKGAQSGISSALHIAVSRGDEAIVRWCLENGQPDLGWKNYEGKTALTAAKVRQHETIIQLLQDWGATE